MTVGEHSAHEESSPMVVGKVSSNAESLPTNQDTHSAQEDASKTQNNIE
jgi:hypothetical protein